MTYEFLPREEPGKPLMRVSPGFADRVMHRFEEYERQQKRRRTITIALTFACLLGGGFFLRAWLIDDGGKAAVPRMQAGPVTPPLKPAPAPDLAATVVHPAKLASAGPSAAGTSAADGRRRRPRRSRRGPTARTGWA